MSPIMRIAFETFEKCYPICTRFWGDKFKKEYEELDALLVWWKKRQDPGFVYYHEYENEIWDIEAEKFGLLAKYSHIVDIPLVDKETGESWDMVECDLKFVKMEE